MPLEVLVQQTRQTIRGAGMEEGVGCEACQGPGGDYWKTAVMATASGRILPNEGTCKRCHGPESPGYKTCDEQIAHLIPKGATED